MTVATNELRVKRWPLAARVVHWNNLIMVLILIFTGVALYVPGANVLASLIGGFFITRTLHRSAAVLFILVPLAAIVAMPGGFMRFQREVYTWGKDDTAWLLSFPRYFFKPSTSMPPVHGKSTSGQRALAWVLILGALIQVVTGPILWLRPASKAVVLWAVLFHDVGFLLLAVGVIFHAYVGLGIFKPYRGVGWGMLGNGTVPAKLAKHHWPEWYEEELKKESGSV